MSYIIHFSKFFNILIWFLGGFDNLLLVLIMFISVECISSILTFFLLHKFSFKSIAQWISNKCMLFLLLGIINTIDSFLIIKNNEPLRTITLLFYISYEYNIILKNSTKLGLPIPKNIINFVDKILKYLKDENSNN